MSTENRPSEKPKTVKERDAEELAIIHPERVLELQGVPVTVRPFGFVESLYLERHALPITKALESQVGPGQKERSLDVPSLMAAIGDNRDSFLELVQASTGKDREFLDSLTDEDGLRLMVAFWEVHGPFFVRRLVLAASAKESAKRATEKSFPASLTTAIPSPKSGDTPESKSNSSTESPSS